MTMTALRRGSVSRTSLAAAACIAIAGCSSARPPRASQSPATTARPPIFDPAAPPGGRADAVARGDAAIAELQRRLAGRLAAALQAGGPAAAVTVCRDEARRLAADVADEHGVSLGRTSDRLRNPRNAAPAWAGELVDSAGPAAANVRPAAVDLGDRIGLLRPIVAAQACTRCHGSLEEIAPDVRERLSIEYPDDRAVGYAAGDHRGFFWVEVPRK
jgi:hypothetical protein